jgi:hypothetical protein
LASIEDCLMSGLLGAVGMLLFILMVYKLVLKG